MPVSTSVAFTQSRATKNTVVYVEEDEGKEIGVIYLPKVFLEKHFGGIQQRVILTVQSA